uniref:Uncharacterized protein n=1 Tax=Meloidogyne enterolobii TaxID=390850 RepID=A0A6V7U2C6_MELEN|nr:unnamed protein product [Meloidogyne enterolobii]
MDIEEYVKNLINKEIEQKIEQLKEEIRSGKLFTLQPPTSNTTSNENTSTDVSEPKQNNFNEGRPSSTVKRYIPPSMRQRTREIVDLQLEKDKLRYSNKERIPSLNECFSHLNICAINPKAGKWSTSNSIKTTAKPLLTSIIQYNLDIFKNVEDKRSVEEWFNYAEKKCENGEFCLNPLISVRETSRVSKSEVNLSNRFKF